MTLLGAPLSTLIPAGLAAASALVALYLLRPQRRRLEVPYARLWGLVAQEARATSVARRLRRWESLLLQLVLHRVLRVADRGTAREKHCQRPTPRRHPFLLVGQSSGQTAERCAVQRGAINSRGGEAWTVGE